MFKYNLGESVYLKDNFVELWESAGRSLPMQRVIEALTGMLGTELEVLDRSSDYKVNVYNINGFGVEEYLLTGSLIKRNKYDSE